MTYDQYGDESVLTLTEQPLPTVGPSQIRIRVTRSSVNPVDWKVMSGALDELLDVQERLQRIAAIDRSRPRPVVAS